MTNKLVLRSRVIQDTQVKSAQDRLFSNLRQLITSPAAITASTFNSGKGQNSGNTELARCLNESGSIDCRATGTNTFVGFELYDEHLTRYSSSWPERIVPLDQDGKWPKLLTLFEGIRKPTPQYDKNMKRCKSTAECPLVPFTAFRAWCPRIRYDFNLPIVKLDEQGAPDFLAGRPDKCDVAEYIQFFIAVGGTTYTSQPVAVGPGRDPLRTKHNFFASSPSRLGTKTREPDEIFITVKEILSNGAQLCSDGMSTVGLDSSGRPKCEYETNPCVVQGVAGKGFIIPSYENGKLSCKKPFQGESCRPLEVFYGTDKSGNMICKRPKFNVGCGKNQIAVSFNHKGEPVCIRSHSNQQCPKPALLVGFDANGIAICKASKTLFAGKYVTPHWTLPDEVGPDDNIDSDHGDNSPDGEAPNAGDGNTGCPHGMKIVKLIPSGELRCEFETNPCETDARFTGGYIVPTYDETGLKCSRPTELLDQCPKGQVVYGVDEIGSIICKSLTLKPSCDAEKAPTVSELENKSKCTISDDYKACPPPAVLAGFDTDGLAICKLKDADGGFVVKPVIPASK